jgi:hypothetical protein
MFDVATLNVKRHYITPLQQQQHLLFTHTLFLSNVSPTPLTTPSPELLPYFELHAPYHILAAFALLHVEMYY